MIERTMRMASVLLVSLMVVANLLVASETKQPNKIDTLAIEPKDAGNLSETIQAWLEGRDYVIPHPWEEGLPVVHGVAGNTIVGSFITAGQQDVAVLVVHSETINEDYELWVFPAGDTLAAEKIGPLDSADYDWLDPWWSTFRFETQLSYAWRIESASPQDINRFIDRIPNADKLPELTRDAIHINIGDKPYGSFYYFDGKKWIKIDYLG